LVLLQEFIKMYGHLNVKLVTQSFNTQPCLLTNSKWNVSRAFNFTFVTRKDFVRRCSQPVQWTALLAKILWK